LWLKRFHLHRDKCYPAAPFPVFFILPFLRALRGERLLLTENYLCGFETVDGGGDDASGVARAFAAGNRPRSDTLCIESSRLTRTGLMARLPERMAWIDWRLMPVRLAKPVTLSCIAGNTSSRSTSPGWVGLRSGLRVTIDAAL